MAFTVARCVKTTKDEVLDWDSFLSDLVKICETYDLRERLTAVQGRLRLNVPVDDSSDRRACTTKTETNSSCSPLRHLENGFKFAIDCLTYVLFMFFRHGINRPAESLVRMIAIGGDCDTTASMLGSLLGALHGPDWILEDWMRPLLKVDEVKRLALKLAGLDCQSIVERADIDHVKKSLQNGKIPERHD